MRVFRGLCQFNQTNVMSRSLVLFLTVFNGYQRYGHSKYTFHHTEKKGKIVGSIGFRIATFVRTNFNLVKQCVVFSIMLSVQTL